MVWGHFHALMRDVGHLCHDWFPGMRLPQRVAGEAELPMTQRCQAEPFV